MKEFFEWSGAYEEMGLFAETGDRAGWEAARDRAQKLEDEIFVLTGKRPPYGMDFGRLVGEVIALGE